MNPTERRPIRLLVVDDHEVVRAGLRAMLGKFSQLEIVGEADTVASAVKEAARLKPDVVLLDVRLPDGSGFEVCRQIRALNSGTHVLFLTSYSDDETLAQVVAASADGFLLKDAGGEKIVAAIENLHAGRSILDPAVTRRVLEYLKSSATRPQQSKLDQLSAQEKKVLALVAQGKTNKEIGVELNLSDKTVKNYLSNAMGKLHMSRRAQAAVFFAQHHSSHTE